MAEGERTEPATPKRLEQARKKGDVAQSKDFSAVFLLGTALLLGMSALGASLAQGVVLQARDLWSLAARPPGSLNDFQALLMHHLSATGADLLPLLAVLMVAGVFVTVVQVGPSFSLEALQFDLARLSPAKGLKRLVKPEAFVDLAKAAVKVVILVAIFWAVFEPSLERILASAQTSVIDGLALAGILARDLLVASLPVLLVLALADLWWMRYRHAERHKMTKHEVREEHKQREGDPKLRGAIRSRQREMTRQRMIAEVADADVVVTNPTHYAVALAYQRDRMSAPRVIAKGRNHVAERIREVAREAGVPVVENPPLARVLYRTVRVGREVPEALYQAVAEVLAYVYRLDRRKAEAWGQPA